MATDIAARGIDVTQISHVINYDIPNTTDAYIHRIGRTGRVTRTGDAFTLTTADDMEMVRKIEKIMKEDITQATFPDFNYTAARPEPQQNNGGRPSKGTRNRTSEQQSGFRQKVRNR